MAIERVPETDVSDTFTVPTWNGNGTVRFCVNFVMLYKKVFFSFSFALRVHTHTRTYIMIATSRRILLLQEDILWNSRKVCGDLWSLQFTSFFITHKNFRLLVEFFWGNNYSCQTMKRNYLPRRFLIHLRRTVSRAMSPTRLVTPQASFTYISHVQRGDREHLIRLKGLNARIEKS